MDGEAVAEYTFKRKHQVVTLDRRSTVKIDGESVQIDTQLLFQILALSAKTADDLPDVFKYELCSHPPAVFDLNQLLQQPQKPVLADAICALLAPDDTSIPVCVGWWSTCPVHPMDTWGHIPRHMPCLY